MIGDKAGYWRYFTDGRSGERVLGQMQGNGGVAVGLATLRRERALLRSGERHRARFFEPQPGFVRIRRAGKWEYDDPAGWVDWPLATLLVECRACEELRTKWAVCACCERQRVGDEASGVWVGAPVGGYPDDARISHTYCPTCFEARYSDEAIERMAQAERSTSESNGEVA
jgi:hypothetical protein